MADGAVAPLAEGRMAEILGPKAFDIDRAHAAAEVPRPVGRREWTSYHPERKRIFTAYADGVNAFIAAHRGQPAGGVQADRHHTRAVDARRRCCCVGRIGIDSVRGRRINEIQLALNVEQLGVKEANRQARPIRGTSSRCPRGSISMVTDDRPRRGAQASEPFAPGVLPVPEIVAAYRPLVPRAEAARLLPELQDMDGSNNWVVSGKHTASGKPIVVQRSAPDDRDAVAPLLRPLVAPGWNVIGAGEPPFVGVDVGHNEHMAWGFTFAGTDMVDVFVERTNPGEPEPDVVPRRLGADDASSARRSR